MSSPITTHVLDTHLGKPAAGVDVTLSLMIGGEWKQMASGTTNADGRISDWLEGAPRQQGTYRIEFATDPYFEAQGLVCFFPQVSFEFRISDINEHYHVPLLISAHGLSTYRGS